MALSTDPKSRPSAPRTLDVVPNLGEMIKPGELIDVSGAGSLTHSARRLYNLLVAHAFGPEMAQEGREFEIPLADIKGTHAGNDRLYDSIIALMKTIVIVKLPEGGRRHVALLGSNDIADSTRKPGVLRYTFDPKLMPILRESKVFGVLELRVMAAFSTKYSLALYEAVSRRFRMQRCSEDFDLDEFRDLLGVPDGKLSRLPNLRARAIEPAIAEIQTLAPLFNVAIEDIKRGKRVVGFRLWWSRKSPDEYRAAMAELERPRAGRVARIQGDADPVVVEALIEA